jgi:hypothetical protein
MIMIDPEWRSHCPSSLLSMGGWPNIDDRTASSTTLTSLSGRSPSQSECTACNLNVEVEFEEASPLVTPVVCRQKFPFLRSTSTVSSSIIITMAAVLPHYSHGKWVDSLRSWSTILESPHPMSYTGKCTPVWTAAESAGEGTVSSYYQPYPSSTGHSDKEMTLNLVSQLAWGESPAKSEVQNDRKIQKMSFPRGPSK